jgi:hypothetical protein
MFEAIYFTSLSFPDLELHAVRKKTVITSEGFAYHFWMTILLADGTDAAPAPVDEETEQPIRSDDILSEKL